MNSKLLFELGPWLGLVLLAGIFNAKLDEYNNEYDESEKSEKKEATSDEETKIVEDPNDETSMALAAKKQDADAQKHIGFCNRGVAVWYKPGSSVRCGCMRCTCQSDGSWECGFYFSYCPYFYCGNVIYNPQTQICCCGKVHDKKHSFSCCGYFYYDRRISQCCNYFSVKPKKAVCPRFRP